jgi:NAD-dependent SIR2 family protein deacetylase
LINFKKRINLAAQVLKYSKYLVAFTGAGISTESGLPDYRGIWNQETESQKFYEALSVNWNCIKPNKAHIALVKLQESKILKFLISQNIDNLHIRSGFPEEKLIELHRNLTLLRCLNCGKKIKKTWDRPINCTCGGIFKPFIVKDDEDVPKIELEKALHQVSLADVFLVIGSSLITQPAGELPKIAHKKGSKLIIINRGATELDNKAYLRFHENISLVLSDILTHLNIAYDKP